MKFAICQIPGSLSGFRTATPEAQPHLGTSWLQFGDRILLHGEDGPSWQSSLGRLADADMPAQDLSVARDIPRESLHLVMQKGRLFQQEHPEVPVLFDHGRYLLVSLSAARVQDLGSRTCPCYDIRPIADQEVVFQRRHPAAREAPAPWLPPLVDSVQRASLESDLLHLTRYPTRHSFSPHYRQAAAWAAQELGALGYTVSEDTVHVGPRTSTNVIANKAGSGPTPRDLVYVVAHLDSVNHHGTDQDAPAPGADDNASGSAGLLQIARALRAHPSQHDLRLVLFGAEEQGLHGSIQHVRALPAADRARISAVLNMDMIGCQNSPSPGVLLEGSPISQVAMDALADAAAAFTTLEVQTSLNPFASDHVPFINAGLPGVLTIEAADSANDAIHSGNDGVANLNFDLAVQILRMNTAFIASQLGIHPQSPA